MMARRPTPILDAIQRDHPIAGGLLRVTVARTLDRQDVPILAKDVPAATIKVVNAIVASPSIAVVEVKSTWLSKINATQFIGLAATGLAWVGLDVTEAQLLGIFAAVQTIVAFTTWVLKTWFTKTVTPQSKPA